jgi:CRISPR/Cas system CSM-associated protein Csm5 (group 7 of RAMP superfamily)
MSSGFETPGKFSADNTTPESSNEKIERFTATEAFDQALDETKAFLVEEFADEVERRHQADPSVHLQGTDWQLAELSEDSRAVYEKIAFMQKRVAELADKLEEALQKNQQASQPGSPEESISYFQVQILGNLKNTEQKRMESAADEHGLQLQHPALYEALAATRRN